MSSPEPPTPPDPLPGPPSPDGGGPPSDPAAREGGCLALVGVTLFPLVALGFAFRADVPILHAFFLSGLVALLPVLAIAQVPVALRTGLERLPAYWGSALTILALGTGALLLGLERGGPEFLGLEPVPLVDVGYGTALVLGGAALLTGAFLGVGSLLELDESPLLRQLIPRTTKEKTVFAGLSVVAGLGEEIAYRGYAITMLAPVLGGAWPAAAFTSLAFGVLHAYQGPVGILRTAALGMVFATSFVVLESLWPAVVAHVIVDLVGGLVLGERIR